MSGTNIDDDRQKKERSPSYPFISLKRAVERVQELAENHKRNPARLNVVASTWNYGLKSSGLLQTVAALKQYGLIDDLREQDRKIQVSALAWRYLHDDRPGAKENALQESALRPKLFAEYNKLWAMGRPSDHHCVSELQFDRGFTQEAAKTFLRAFDETMIFANLVNPDKEKNSLEKSNLDFSPPQNVSQSADFVRPDPTSSEPLPREPDNQMGFQLVIKTDPNRLVITGTLTNQAALKALIDILDKTKAFLPEE